MGAIFGVNCTCGQCEICTRHCAGDRCSAVCLASRAQQETKQNFAQDCAPPPKPERYSLAGAECPPVHLSVCGDFELMAPRELGGAPYEDGQYIPDHLDRVRPLPKQPAGTDLENLGGRQCIESLEDECRFNAGKVKKIRCLAETYSHWRSVRGDGNCYYRSVIVGTLEFLLASGVTKRWEQLLGAFQQVHYGSPEERRAHDRMMNELQSWENAAEVEHWVAQDAPLDQALIRGCRRLVRLFLLRHADSESPSGLTYEQVAHALAYASIEDYCARVVDPMGRDAETLVLDALPKQLGVGIRLWFLDRLDEVELFCQDHPGNDGKIDVHLLFQPGHYDLLYPRDSSTGTSCSGSASTGGSSSDSPHSSKSNTCRSCDSTSPGQGDRSCY